MMELLPLLGQMFPTSQISSTPLHAFTPPPYSYNAMGLFLLTEVSRNSSALPGVGSAEGGGNTCEGQERRGISSVVRHSRVCGNPVLSLSTGMALQVVRQGMCRSPIATTTVLLSLIHISE